MGNYFANNCLMLQIQLPKHWHYERISSWFGDFWSLRGEEKPKLPHPWQRRRHRKFKGWMKKGKR